MDLDGCPLPDDLLYDLEHDVWVRPSPDSAAAVELGLTGVLAAFAGRFTAASFRPISDEVPAGRSVATVESLRYTGPIRLPVDGRIVARNDRLTGRPRLLNDAPYAEGWVVRFIPARPSELAARMVPVGEAAKEYRPRIARQRIRCYAALPDLELLEIGAECSAILARVDEELAPRLPGEVLLLVTDDPTSPIEMVRWSDRTGHTVVEHRVEDRLHHFLLRKEAHPVPRRRPG